jgi:hypothetical protein
MLLTTHRWSLALVFCLATVIGFGSCSEASEAGSSALPVSQLYLEIDVSSLPGSLRFIAENRGSANMVLFRPRGDMLESYGDWAGWQIEIKGPGGLFIPRPFPGPVVPFTAQDLMELAVGQKVEAVVGLAGFVSTNWPASGNPIFLGETPGDYTVAISYRLDQKDVRDCRNGGFVTVLPCPPVQSAPVSFRIGAKD